MNLKGENGMVRLHGKSKFLEIYETTYESELENRVSLIKINLIKLNKKLGTNEKMKLDVIYI